MFVSTAPTQVFTQRHTPMTHTTVAATDEAVLMSRHLAGDNDAFLELFARLNHKLYVYSLKLLGDTEQAEDVTQEVWEKLIMLRCEPLDLINPIGYILKMARNLCLTQIKNRKRLSHFSTMEEGRHPAANEYDRSELEEIVLAALDSLPVEYREVLILNVYCGYSLAEIAEMLEKSTDAIWKRASRARDKLRTAVLSMPDFQQQAANGIEL
jgi:RNA polymerase sigma-70 factor (ECF subfamily)